MGGKNRECYWFYGGNAMPRLLMARAPSLKGKRPFLDDFE